MQLMQMKKKRNVLQMKTFLAKRQGKKIEIRFQAVSLSAKIA